MSETMQLRSIEVTGQDSPSLIPIVFDMVPDSAKDTLIESAGFSPGQPRFDVVSALQYPNGEISYVGRCHRESDESIDEENTFIVDTDGRGMVMGV